MTNQSQSHYLYERIADHYQYMISKGLLSPGDKLPSVRSLSKTQDVSISTALQSYLALERRGYVESRPKSGYYVRHIPTRSCTLPTCQIPSTQGKPQETEDIIRKVYGDLSDPDIVALSLNVPHFDLLPTTKLKTSARRVVSQQHDALIGYGHVQGSQNLREQIAKICFHKGIVVDAEGIIVTAGGLEAINLTIQATTSPGDTIAVESPTHFGIFQAIEAQGRKVIEVHSRPEDGINLDDLERCIPEHDIKACIFVTNFSNPLGVVLSDEKKQKLVDLLNVHEVVLIENDIYGDMYFDTKRPTTCRQFDDGDQVIYSSSFSKTLVPGYRVGYIIAGRWKTRVIDVKLNYNVASPMITQEILADFLTAGRFELHLKQLRKALHLQSIQYLDAILTHFPASIHITIPKGGFVFWIELPNHVDTTILFHRLLDKGVSIAPGQMFSKQADYQNYFRLSFGAPFTPKIAGGIRTIGEEIKIMLNNGNR